MAYSSIVGSEDMDVATTILEQLGGAKIAVMIGCKVFMKDEDTLSFKFKGNRKVNHCSIKLNGNDTYNIEFGKIKKYSYKVIEKIDDVYCDQLASTFEDTTKLRLTLF